VSAVPDGRVRRWTPLPAGRARAHTAAAGSSTHGDMANVDGCAPTHVKDLSPEGVMLGSVLAVATFFVPLPQIMKLVNNRNSYGMQPITLCFVIAYAILGSTAMIAVK